MARFSDVQLIQILQKAARRVNRNLCLFDTTDEISVDNSGNVTPADGTLEDLVLLQAECMLISRDFNADLNNDTGGLFVKDGEQSIDTRQRTIARKGYIDSKFSPCGLYDREIKIEKLKRANGRLIW